MRGIKSNMLIRRPDLTPTLPRPQKARTGEGDFLSPPLRGAGEG